MQYYFAYASASVVTTEELAAHLLMHCPACAALLLQRMQRAVTDINRQSHLGQSWDTSALYSRTAVLFNTAASCATRCYADDGLDKIIS